MTHSNHDATRSFVSFLKSYLCEWRTLIGQHFCQAFSQADKIVICGRVVIVFRYQMIAQFAYRVIKLILFFTEVDESIDISGSPEKTYTLYCSGGEMPR